MENRRVNPPRGALLQKRSASAAGALTIALRLNVLLKART
jgi:hypothetical protein